MPVWVFLYVVQFLCMPVIGTEHWCVTSHTPFPNQITPRILTKFTRPSELLSNTIHLFAFNYYFIITFLGYNALPFLHHTELLLAPIAVTTILWFASLFGFNMSRHFAPVLWAGARLRKHVG